MRTQKKTRAILRALGALAGLCALLYLTGGGWTAEEAKVYEGETAPGQAGFRWIHQLTRRVADYDTTHSRYITSSAPIQIARNSTSHSSGFLRFSPNGIPMDTTGAGHAATLSAGVPVHHDSRVMGLGGTVSGFTGAVACTLRCFRTVADDDAAVKLFEHVFSAGGIYDWPESTFAVAGNAVLSWTLDCSAGVRLPAFWFRLCRADTLP
jgi:hypothetical protein